MRNINNKLIKIVATMILTVIVLINGIPGIIEPIIVLAGDALDYDFTDELEEDRIGIGFKWESSTRTLTITGIKNSEAFLTLPENSTVDIQGNTINIVKAIKCEGDVTIKGNDEAVLKVVSNMVERGNGFEWEMNSIYAPNHTIKIQSGNIDISISNVESHYNRRYNALLASKIIINSGNININYFGAGDYINAISGEKLTINGGVVNLLYKKDVSNVDFYSKGYTVKGTTIINGGIITIITDGYNGAYQIVPSINPEREWKIIYNEEKSSIDEAVAADITDIYNIYRSKAIKIECTDDRPITNDTPNAQDYNFTDELEEDRIGIGFKWKASTRTLTVTGIKNSKAWVILPENSTIDIQGNSINAVKTIKCEGDVTIKGNDEAVLKIVSYWIESKSVYERELYGIYVPEHTIKIESGNIDISVKPIVLSNYNYRCNAIFADKIIIDSGNINISYSGTINYINAISGNKLIVDGGNINLFSSGTTITADTTINGGSITAMTDSSEGVYQIVPSINPEKEWNIKYNETIRSLEDAVGTDITEIYNIYKSKAIKIAEKIIPIYELGDVNKDNKINSLDAVEILKYVAKKKTLTDEQLALADTTRDNKVNSLDAVRILKYVAKKIDKI